MPGGVMYVGFHLLRSLTEATKTVSWVSELQKDEERPNGGFIMMFVKVSF